MARLMNRRAALAAFGVLAAGSVLGVGYGLRGIFESRTPGFRLTNGPGDGGMIGVGPADMSSYMDMFMRHNQINRVVDEIPGGVRTTTESNSPDLAAQLQAHVSSMYDRLGQGSEVMCMSSSLPTLFRNAGGYRRQLTFTPTGVIAEETADDPNIVEAIRDHAREVSGFVREGMPAMMQGMMGGGMMGPGGMMRPPRS
ncbi:hypothetical protein [Mycolicibacterium hippocampi]|uniref:Uncharacterized protein n=1 Tax=Mycolicibacterium hippocampi TaxID=659824 RepID=A0A850PQX8_9MYCO|nr:hypothetical protein [Mycolicibacterium hippocampi]NVN52922.1 hypothetical protein [Mycolicibacterium hippocampi]